ncbi:MAG: helix-turn-helix transcriptional regulator [Oscillospiraceae bacterium]|nr:helix-turn-helix transcriptional regulator [Oscillospiraceae bacterium]
MVENLNTLSFAKFGSIRPERPAEARMPQEDSWQIRLLDTAQYQKRLFCSQLPVHLDYASGMTVLAVRLAGAFQLFYLDKPVTIAPGVKFALLPFTEASTVRMAAQVGQWPEAADLPEPLHSLQLTRKLAVSSIFTFFYQEKEQGFFFPGEKHPMLELTYVDSGHIHSVSGGHEMTLAQGEFTIYGSNQWHMQYTDANCVASYITITFELAAGELTPLLNLKGKADQAAAALLRQMLREWKEQKPYAEDMLICLLETLLLTLLRKGLEKPKAALQTANALCSENEVIGHAMQYIGKHLYEKLSVPVVAREAGVSPSYLTALFRKNMQISPGECIRRMKLEESRRLIREGSMNFTQIAQLLQYSTVHHFSRQFKEKFGITPSQYAKSIHP